MKTTGQEFVLETFDRKKKPDSFTFKKNLHFNNYNLIEISQVNQKRNEFFKIKIAAEPPYWGGCPLSRENQLDWFLARWPRSNNNLEEALDRNWKKKRGKEGD